MERTVKQTTHLLLKLTDSEAGWLNGVMQNPLFGESPETENPRDATMRKAFFRATDLTKKDHYVD